MQFLKEQLQETDIELFVSPSLSILEVFIMFLWLGTSGASQAISRLMHTAAMSFSSTYVPASSVSVFDPVSMGLILLITQHENHSVFLHSPIYTPLLLLGVLQIFVVNAIPSSFPVLYCPNTPSLSMC